VAVLAALVLIAIVTGCAEPMAGSASSPAGAPGPTGDLAGVWHGSYGWIGASFLADDGDCVLRIEENGTFTMTITPAKAASNIAKASAWSGTVVIRGNRVTLRASQGPWFILVRSGTTLYGVSRDPAVEVTIMIRFDRDGG
jgi:hypothetical protein